MQKIFILFAALVFLIVGSACYTPKLYDRYSGENRTFVEEISAFLITEDNKQLIVVGKQHHYVFTTLDTLKFILNWAEKQRVKATFSNFTITNDQVFYGSYTLTIAITQDLTEETQKMLLVKGFKMVKNDLVYEANIHGTRYLADKFVLPKSFAFNQNYAVTIHENYVSTATIVKRILLTPLAVAADGALILGSIPAAILALPLLRIN